MPHYKSPKQFPGVASLPGPIRGLVESLFPADEVPSPMGMAASGARQVMPSCRDAIEMLKRLQGGLSRVPTAKRVEAPMSQSVKDMMHPSAMQMQEKMYQEANPIFKQMQARGMFDRGQAPRAARPSANPWLAEE